MLHCSQKKVLFSLVNMYVCMCVCRLGMLGDESVPHADSLLTALTKHLEVKLAFGETPPPPTALSYLSML